jgi:hypothetical protein
MLWLDVLEHPGSLPLNPQNKKGAEAPFEFTNCASDAGAITDAKGPYESYDIPKGTLRGAPPVPGDDVTMLRVAYDLVANRHLNAGLVTDLARKVMSARRDLVGEQPLLSGIAAPDTDPDAYISVHSGAACWQPGQFGLHSGRVLRGDSCRRTGYSRPARRKPSR